MRETKKEMYIFLFKVLMGSKCAYRYTAFFHLIHHKYLSMSYIFITLKFKIEFC